MEKLIVNLRGKFWTSQSEMIEELNELGYEVLDANDESITFSHECDEYEEEFTLKVITAGRTIAIDI